MTSASTETEGTECIRILVDGLIKHSRSLKVELEEDPGRYVTAEVRDPAFDEQPNPYIEAMAAGRVVDVVAKKTYRQGVLVKLRIVDLVGGPNR